MKKPIRYYVWRFSLYYLLTLFAASVGYHKAMRNSVQQRVKDNLSGHGHRHLIEDEELRLRHNGRKAA